MVYLCEELFFSRMFELTDTLPDSPEWLLYIYHFSENIFNR